MEMPMVPVEHSDLNKILVDGPHNPRRNKHQHHIPIILVQSKRPDTPGCHPGNEGIDPIIFISDPSQSAFDEPEGQRRCAQKRDDRQVFGSERFFQIFESFGERPQRLYQLQNRTNYYSIFELLDRLPHCILYAPMFMITKSCFPVYTIHQ